MKKEFKNLPSNLKDLVNNYWDDSGNPLVKDPETLLIIDLLKKNIDVGFPGFKLDMGRVFEKEQFNDTQLDMYYKVHMAGIKYAIDDVLKTNEKSKPKMN